MNPPRTFRQADLSRAIRAAKAAGLAVLRSEITPEGVIVLVHSDQGGESRSPFDEWKQRNAG